MRAGALIAIGIACGCEYHGRPLFDPDARGDDTPDASGDDAPDAADPPDAPVVVIDASPDAASSGCPDDYAPLAGAPGSSRYRVIAGFVNWGPAESDCDDDGTGTHLVVVDSAEESAALDAAFFGDLWLGASDRRFEGTFLAVTGGPAPYLNWGLFQPDDFFGQDCVGLDEGGGYSDRDCGASRGFICECDGIEPDPNAF